MSDTQTGRTASAAADHAVQTAASTAQRAGATVAETGQKISDAASSAAETARDLGRRTASMASEAGDTTARWRDDVLEAIEEQPVRAAVIAGVLGLIAGAWLVRRNAGPVGGYARSSRY